MKIYKLCVIPFLLLSLLSLNAIAQKTSTKKPVKKTVQKTQPTKAKKSPTKSSPVKVLVPLNEVEGEKRVRDIVTFFQYMLNTLGSSSTSTRDKEVLATESYSKIFRDNKVQIEDDLDDERIVVTNKDIVPYLKDVDFFFKDVKFEFTIEDLKSHTLPTGELFYKVSSRRTLTGTTTEGKSITNTQPRYIEVNYNPADQDLKIVSVYTNEFNETEALTNWWNDLSLEWKTILRKKLPPSNQPDSLLITDIKIITSAEELDLSNNVFVQNIEPLARLTVLKSLNLAGTNVSDLTPIRNLAELTKIDLSHTKVADLTPLKYSSKLVTLNISHSMVSDISVVEKMPNLQDLNMNNAPVSDFSPLAALPELRRAGLASTKIANLSPLENLTQLLELNLSQSAIQEVDPLRNLTNLKILDIDSTRVSNLDALSKLENLTTLSANYTSVASLMPLQKLTHLEKVYVDHTNIDRQHVDDFIATHSKAQIIFDSDDLKTWWEALSPEWQEALSKAAHVGLTPTKEEMAKVPQLDSINIGNLSRINSLEPLRKLKKLRVIIANKTAIRDLSPLQEHSEIRYLDISETDVVDISTVSRLNKLKVFRADKSKIENIERHTLQGLELFYADNTAVHDITAKEFIEKNPKCLLIYKTIHLNRWWNALPENWKDVFQLQIGKDTNRENLHKLAEQESLHFKDATVSDLNPLSEFIRLRELHFSGTAITTIPPLENIKSLTSLHATNSPIQQIESLGLLADLEDLDLSNTPIEELNVIGNLKNLKKLNCAGTQIKRLEPLENLESLNFLDCSNTNVNKLDALYGLPLKTLTCYNTRVSNRVIENFKVKHPDCNVVYYR